MNAEPGGQEAGRASERAGQCRAQRIFSSLRFVRHAGQERLQVTNGAPAHGAHSLPPVLILSLSCLRACGLLQSWDASNLYNLWRRSIGGRAKEALFTKASNSLFQQRWLSKKLLRAYHGDYINEGIFRRWYLPSMLPDIRTRVDRAQMNLAQFASRPRDLESLRDRQEQFDQASQAPVTSLMWSEIERRIDTVIFRACLAKSVYQARHLVIHGHVKLNGEIVSPASSSARCSDNSPCYPSLLQYTDPNTRLAPGDLVTVNSEAMPILSRKIRIRWKKGPSTKPARGSDQEKAQQKELDRMIKAAEADPEDPEDAMVEATKLAAASRPGGKLPPLLQRARTFHLPHYAAPFIFIPAYLEVSFPACSVVFVRHPSVGEKHSEIPTPYDADGEVMRLAWEWYAKRRANVRSKRKLASQPKNRQGQMVFAGIEMRSSTAGKGRIEEVD